MMMIDGNNNNNNYNINNDDRWKLDNQQAFEKRIISSWKS